MWERFSVFGKVVLGTIMGFYLSIALNGCGASVVGKAVVKEQIIIPKKHKHHHRHYYRF